MKEAPRHVTSGVAAQRACDECRIRKTRCDRTEPCSHCRSAGLTCRTTAQRPKEHKDRVQVTKQYETKIDRIESRLANIEQLLRQGSSPLISSHASSVYLPEENDGPSEHQTPIMADLGFEAESMAAKDVLEQTVDADPMVQHDPQLKSALTSLRHMVDRAQTDLPGPYADVPTANSSWSNVFTGPVTLPAWEEVVPLIKRAEGSIPLAFMLLSPAVFIDFCRKSRAMLENGQRASPSDQVLVYASMSNMCSEFSGMSEGKEAEDYHRLGRKFSYFLDRTLAAFPLTTPPSMGTIEALLAASLALIDVGKPLLSWVLTCTAARMCESLGYNRMAQVKPDSDPNYHRKVKLFWDIFGMNRASAFRLGRAPALQDYDIDTPMVVTSPQNSTIAVKMTECFVECGRIQGIISTQLYGPAAAALPTEERVRLAQNCADRLEAVFVEKTLWTDDIARSLGGPSNKIVEIWTAGDEIMKLSILSTALHAIPTTHPHRARALEAARECLRRSYAIGSSYSKNPYTLQACCNWLLLQVPLTPFTGIFCNIVANPLTSGDDLQLLQDYVGVFRPAIDLGTGIEKFYQLCCVFVNVAQTYVGAKIQQQRSSHSQTPSQSLQPAINEFDEYFAALGFFGQSSMGHKPTNEQHFQTAPNVESADADGSVDFQDWYAGNVSLYGLLEHDLLSFVET